MKIAIALRTCGKVFNWWDVPDRMVNVSKPTLLLTCLNSLAKAIKNSKHEIIFSIHDDNSGDDILNKMDEVLKQNNVEYQLIHTKPQDSCMTQYDWLRDQECDYFYQVEDDYLHTIESIDSMVEICEFMKVRHPDRHEEYNEFAVFPVNHPHRYMPNHIYPCLIFMGPDRYWRTVAHSSLTFLISKKAFFKYEDFMFAAADGWTKRITEDYTINQLWISQQVKLLNPMTSLAWHIASEDHEEKLSNWRNVWNENLVEG